MNKPLYILMFLFLLTSFQPYSAIAQTNLIPNIFSPNNDGVNDQIDFSYLNLAEIIVSVYNRWGQKVFETTSTNIVWDGKNKKGIVCPDGVYYYVFQYADFINKKIDKKGFIQLVR